MNRMEKNNRVTIIAEAGVNYNGDVELAKKMVRVAKDAGADIVKFQSGKPRLDISVYAKKAEYQKVMTGADESQLEMAEKLMLPDEVYPELVDCCREEGIEFLSTPFDIPCVDLLVSVGQRRWKIPSGEITSLPLLIYIARRREPVILSTGMATMNEIETAIHVLREYGTEDITVLQCNSDYPTPYEDANIRAMLTMRDAFGVKVGYSDHTNGIIVPVAATALGASVIEKHFTLDKNMPGPDQKASMDPGELKAFVKAVRDTETALGTGIKVPGASELRNKDIVRKSIVASRPILKGEILTEDNLTWKRPGDGISAMKWFEVLGTSAVKDFEYDEQIVLE